MFPFHLSLVIIYLTGGEQRVTLVVQKLKRHTMSQIKMGNKEKILAELRFAGSKSIDYLLHSVMLFRNGCILMMITNVVRLISTAPNLETVTWEDTEMQTIQLIGKLQCSRMTVHVNPLVLRKDAMSK